MRGPDVAFWVAGGFVVVGVGLAWTLRGPGVPAASTPPPFAFTLRTPEPLASRVQFAAGVQRFTDAQCAAHGVYAVAALRGRHLCGVTDCAAIEQASGQGAAILAASLEVEDAGELGQLGANLDALSQELEGLLELEPGALELDAESP